MNNQEQPQNPQGDANASNTKVAASNDDFSVSISFENYSGTGFYLQQWTVPDSTAISNETDPTDTLQAIDGSTSIGCDMTLGIIGNGPYDMYCLWTANDNSFTFGVKIHVPIQVYGMGTRPYYEVMSGSGAISSPSWSGSHTSDNYTWSGLPVKITATPNSAHTSLSVDVQISNPNN